MRIGKKGDYMMKDNKKAVYSAIETFYDENADGLDEDIKSSAEYIDFVKKLQSTKDKLDLLNNNIIDFEIDTLAVIAQADTLKEKKRHRMELGLFIFISLIILSAYVAAGLIFGLQTLIISQVILITLTPWVVLPIAAYRTKRGDSNG